MITSKNIGILLDFIKNSKKNSDLYLLVKKNSISLSSKRKSNFYIKNNNLESKINISKFYQSILNILLPILRKNKKLVIAQIGQSIDGRIALNNGNSHYINNPKSIIYLHCLRSISDAIIVGSNTIKKDDPLLTTRKIKGTNPKRIIIDGSLSLNNKYKIFNDGNENIIFTKSNKNIRLNNSTIIRLKEKNFTKNFITQIKKLKYKNILVEGGSKTISELINNKYIDILQFMIAPILIGSGINSLNLKEISNLNKAIRPKHNFNELENEIIVNLFLNS
jgi:diaminohydroxyphosphoribosylaminopyrimidine deaminase/5-amino-6-(5-phosphoribosylamino)uracil reductase|tara:strand:- start:268 stop:1101 length:834 start_codon:yes stop_codon:yes gene_type:complete